MKLPLVWKQKLSIEQIGEAEREAKVTTAFPGVN